MKTNHSKMSLILEEVLLKNDHLCEILFHPFVSFTSVNSCTKALLAGLL